MKKIFNISVSIILLSVIIFPLLTVDAQRPTQQILQNLIKEGKTGCEVWQINEFFHLPVRINILHERVTGEGGEFKWTSQDPASDLFWEGAPTTFQMVTSDPDRYTAELILDYQEKHENPRQVFFQVYSQDNVLQMEGNWVHEGFTFCKIIEFSTSPAPHILTPEEIQKENNQFNSEMRADFATGQTTIENAIIWITVVLMLFTIFQGIQFFLNINQHKKTSAVANKPVKKLDQVIEIFRKVVANQKFTVSELIRNNNMMVKEQKEFNEKFFNTLDRRMEDLCIVSLRARKTVDNQDAYPSAKSLVLVDNKKSDPISEQEKEPVIEKKKQSWLDSKIYGKEAEFIKTELDSPEHDEPVLTDEKPYGGFIIGDEDDGIVEYQSNEEPEKLNDSGSINLSTVTSQEPVSVKEQELSDEIIQHTGDPVQGDSDLSPKEDEIKMKDIPPCETCGESFDEMVQCNLCKGVYCEPHEPTHKCIKDLPKEKSDSSVLTVAKKSGGYLKDQFLDPKPPKVTDNFSIDTAIANGRTIDSITNDLKETYLKNGRNENSKLYEQHHKEYSEKPTVATDIKLKALLEVLQSQLY